MDVHDERLITLRKSYANIVRLMGDLDLKMYDTFPWIKYIYHSNKFKQCLNAVKDRDRILDGIIDDCKV